MTKQEQTSNRSVIRVGKTMDQAWKITKPNLWFLIKIVLVIILISLIPSVLVEAVANKSMIALIQLAGIIINLWLALGVIKIALDLVKNKTASFKELFSQGRFLLNFVVAAIIYDLIVFAGLILLIVPGVIWAIKFQFFSYFIVERDLSPIDALKASSKITYGDKWNLFLLGIVLGLLNIAGALALGVGLLITYPIAILAMAYAYINLRSAKFQTLNSNSPQSAS